ncbi:hypothetical protein GGI35DRAFT_487633 [Trichoderma velutinum]
MDRRIETLLTSLDELSTPLTRIDERVNNLLEEVEKDQLEKLMDFISSEKFGKGHVTIKESRIEGTGDWLIKHEGLRDWQAIPSSSTLLCLKGTVGTGKTYLTSRVIDHIKQTLETSAHDEGFAFFYCNRSGPSMLDPLVVLRSFVRQLSYKAYHYNRIQTSKFLHETLYSQSFFKRREAEIQELIKETFRSQNGGMFRWVYLQVKSLLKCISDDAVKTWARTVPRDLMAAYDQLWENIREQHNEDDVALAERAVKWVLCAFEPPKSDILLEAVRYSLDRDLLVKKEKRSEEEILLLCQDLLTIDAEKEIWTLPHASVAEYFESRNMTLGTCDVFASLTSLNFLMRSEFQPSHYERKDNYFDTFGGYIAHSWFLHIQRYDRWLGSMEGAGPDQALVTTLKRFLGSVEESSDSYREWLNKIDGSSKHAVLTPENMALFVMCRYGFYYVVRDWWEEGKINEEMALKESKSYSNSLALAARGGCLPICRHLVGVIGPSNSLDEGYSRAVEEAMNGGKQDVVSFLVEEANFDVNFCYRVATAVEHAAMYSNLANMLQWLVDQGWVDVNKEGGRLFGNALIAAATNTNVKSTELLLKAGADVNAVVECGHYGSALVAAASTARLKDYLEKIQLLLSHGADPNRPMKGGKYGSALEALIVTAFESQFASRLTENMQALELLLKAGADPAIIYDWGEHGSALAAAAFYGSKDFLMKMIEVTGRERAVECLGQSRCGKELWSRNDEQVARWRQNRSDTVAYLTNQIGVDNETLSRIGLRDVGRKKYVVRFY